MKIDRTNYEPLVNAFKKGWQEADDEGDVGNRVRRGVRALLDESNSPQGIRRWAHAVKANSALIDQLEGAQAERAEVERAAAEKTEAERNALGAAAFAAIVASGADTDGAETWESYFRPLRYPSWVDDVHQNVTSIREERDRAEMESLSAEAGVKAQNEANNKLMQINGELIAERNAAVEERDAALSTIAKVEALADEVIAVHGDRIGTHYADCYKNHVACFAVAIRHRALGSVPSTGEGNDE
ncbi:hypothetical protein [Leucobacter sp. NPDC077196]|uniref:hypothetical protein n=1 Tax=Leucobacter sp. NPDC077196 TaxID=3154959 RepID=UPI0034179C35